MRRLIENNWFKVAIIFLAFIYIFNLLLEIRLEGKKFNLNLYKDSIEFCLDKGGSSKSTLLICNKRIKSFTLTGFLFSNDKGLEKIADREIIFWDCYEEELSKNNYYSEEKQEEICKYCSKLADDEVSK